MKLLFSFYICSICFVFSSYAQLEDEVLFKIDDQEFKVSAFMQSYEKNAEVINSNATESIDDHLERFINFNLKLKSAYDLQLDTLASFQKEFGRYYKQIADSYISNGEVTEAMVKETYDRTKTEIRASHILLNLPQYEKDTAEVYKKALMLKKRAEQGEDFESLAKAHSEDPSGKANGGDLNWFNTFKMVYEFEDAAYKLQVGEISEPVRTEYGYHIIKKTGERPSKGSLKTAHIMLLPGDSLQDPEVRIQKIYKRLEEGEDFHELAKQYSQDPNTADEGGYVTVFKLGGLNSKAYENESFKLEQEGEYSKPFQTKFGWHIVKLIEIIPLEPYEEVKDEYKKRLKSSSRSKVLVSKIQSDLEELYDVKINEEAKTYFLNLMDDSFSKGKWTFTPEEDARSKYMIQVEDRKVDYKTFGEYLERQQRSLSKLPDLEIVVENAINDLVYRELLNYHKQELPSIDAEFKDRIEEYKNGILIFDFMKVKVWEPVSKDTLAQKTYYKKQKNQFKVPEKVSGRLYTSKDKEALETLKSKLENAKTLDSLGTELAENIILENVSLATTSSKLPKRFKVKEGWSKIYEYSNQFLMMDVDEVEKAKVPKLEHVRGKVISDLQELNEDKVISELRSTYKVSINDEIVEQLKDRLEK